MNDTTKIAYIPFNGTAFIEASMLKSKGIAHGIATFKAYEGLFSQALQGGMRGELAATTATHTAIVHTAVEKDLTATGKAFVKISHAAKLICDKLGKPKTQDAHDTALLEISALWAGCFKDAAPKAKSTEPTAKQVIATLQSELHAMVIERDHALSLLAVCQQALADATAQAVTA